MGKRFYQAAGVAIRLFSHRMKTEWEVPFEEGPCVFAANHVGSIGPADMCAKFPMRKRLHPWINHEMLDSKKAAEYVKNDYWFRPGGFAEPLLNATVPHAAALLMPPILRSAPAIPVYHDQRIMLTLRQSLKALQEDEYLLIFPEKQNGWHSYEQKISTGWMRLGELWYRASGRALKIYPVHIDTEKHVFRVSAPVWYDPARRFEEQEKELEDKLTRGIRGR